jgi:RNA-directed DNA polymerase
MGSIFSHLADGDGAGLRAVFEAVLELEEHTYHANRSALDAVQQVHGLVNTEHTQVIDTGMSRY